jgi:hypothetical protein
MTHLWATADSIAPPMDLVIKPDIDFNRTAASRVDRLTLAGLLIKVSIVAADAITSEA